MRIRDYVKEEQHQDRIPYVALDIAYILVALTGYLNDANLGREHMLSSYLFSGLTIVLGAGIYTVGELERSTATKQWMLDLILAISIPVMILTNYDHAPIYGWIVPVCFLLIAMAFRRRRLLAIVLVAALGSLVSLWIVSPQVTIEFHAEDHLWRIVIVILLALFAKCHHS